MQPFVLQYGRVAVDERRRIRRIATERPATEAVAVRVIMLRSISFWLARSAGAPWRWSRRCGRLCWSAHRKRLGVG